MCLMEPMFSQLVRIGGSHAQREVFEDTMLETYIRAEEWKKAEKILRSRLNQRDSVRDTFWLGRVQASQGQGDGAKSSFASVAKAWEPAVSNTPEIATMIGIEAAIA